MLNMHLFLTADDKKTLLDDTNWTDHINAGLEQAQAVEALGDIKELRKFLEMVEGFLKEIVPTKFEAQEFKYEGPRYIATRVIGYRTTLDSARVKTEMGEEWYKERCKTTEFYTLKVTPVEG